MTMVFDPLRQAEVAWDIGCVNVATPEQVQRRQRARLAALLDAARATPTYRELLDGRKAADIALTELPVTHKRSLMRHFDGWVTDPALRLPALRAFTADAQQIAQPFLDRYQVWESSGTSGTPAVFVQDAPAMAVYDALEGLRRARPRTLFGWPDPTLLGRHIAFVGAISGHFASVVSVQRLRRLNPLLGAGVRSFSIAQPIDTLVAQLNDFAPSVLATYPSAAAMLADEAARGALRLDLQEVWTGGETLAAAVRRYIAQQLGCPVRNSYGASEFLAMGWECAEGNMHLNADWVILEPVDRQHRPVPPGTRAHTVLLTNLANHVQPLIRYDLGDQVMFATSRCRCGSPLPVIDVQGRNDDVLVMAGRGARPVTLLPLALCTVMEDDAGVFDFQLCQRDARTLVLRLGLRGKAAVSAAAHCHAVLHAFCADQGVDRLRLVDELDVELQRGRSGKVRRIVAEPAR